MQAQAICLNTAYQSALYRTCPASSSHNVKLGCQSQIVTSALLLFAKTLSCLKLKLDRHLKTSSCMKESGILDQSLGLKQLKTNNLRTHYTIFLQTKR